MSGLTYSPPPPSFSFTLLWGFDDGIQLGKLVMLLGLENVDVNLKSLVLPLTIPSDEDGTGSLWKLLSWRTPWSSNMQDGGRYIIFVQETLFAPMGRHCANTFGDCAALRRPHWPAKQRCPSSPSHRCSCWSTHWDVDEVCIIMGPKFDMLIKLKEDEDLEFIEELTDHAPPKSIKPQKSTMCLSLPLQVRDRRFILDSRSGHDLTSTASARSHGTATASARSQWALPDLNRECQISVGS